MLSTWIDEIRKTVAACQRAEERVEELRLALKEAKEQQTTAHLRLRTLNEALLADDPRPLMPTFDAAEADEDRGTADPLDAPAPAPPSPSRSWQDEPVTVLALGTGVRRALRAANIETMGQLQALRRDIEAGKQSWPKGIGPASIGRIETRVVDWLAEISGMDDEGSPNGQATREGQEAND